MERLTMPAKKYELEPDPTTPLSDTALIPHDEFREKLRAIMSVPKAELDEHIKNNPDAPQKRERKPGATSH